VRLAALLTTVGPALLMRVKNFSLRGCTRRPIGYAPGPTYHRTLPLREEVVRPQRTVVDRRVPTPFHFHYTDDRGLASSPRSCRIMPAEAGTYANGSSEMRVLSSTRGSRGDVEPMAGVAVRSRALGAPAAGGVMPSGAWRF